MPSLWEPQGLSTALTSRQKGVQSLCCPPCTKARHHREDTADTRKEASGGKPTQARGRINSIWVEWHGSCHDLDLAKQLQPHRMPTSVLQGGPSGTWSDPARRQGGHTVRAAGRANLGLGGGRLAVHHVLQHRVLVLQRLDLLLLLRTLLRQRLLARLQVRNQPLLPLAEAPLRGPAARKGSST